MLSTLSKSTFRQLRELAQEIANQPIKVKRARTGQEEEITRIQLILERWASSNDFKAQQAFMEVAFGKVPIINELTGKDGQPIEVNNISSLSDEQLQQIIAASLKSS